MGNSLIALAVSVSAMSASGVCERPCVPAVFG